MSSVTRERFVEGVSDDQLARERKLRLRAGATDTWVEVQDGAKTLVAKWPGKSDEAE